MWQTPVPWVGSTFISTPGIIPDLQPSTSAAFIAPGLSPPLQEKLQSTNTIFTSNRHSVHDIPVDDDRSKDSVGSPVSRGFMQEVEKVVTEKLGGAAQPASSVLGRSHDYPSSLGSSHGSSRKDLGYILPPREQADSLLSSYWNYVHVLYPILNKSQIEEDYDELWNSGNSTTEKRSFLCLLNSIFAISSRQVRSATPDYEHLAATFCLRARELLDIEACSIRSVQSYLLLALYFQSTDESRMSWVFVGRAIHTAQVLELHLFETSEREFESRTRDVLRKVWHGCVLMDREVSMLYGRLCMIDSKTAAAVPLPAVMEEENFQPGHIRSHTIQTPQIHAADFYISSIGLYGILHDVILNFYTQKHFQNGRYDSENFSPYETNTSIVELQDRLSKWEKGIPDYLKVGHNSPYNGMNGVLVRRAVVLHQRYIYKFQLC